MMKKDLPYMKSLPHAVINVYLIVPSDDMYLILFNLCMLTLFNSQLHLYHRSERSHIGIDDKATYLQLFLFDVS